MIMIGPLCILAKGKEGGYLNILIFVQLFSFCWLGLAGPRIMSQAAVVLSSYSSYS